MDLIMIQFIYKLICHARGVLRHYTTMSMLLSNYHHLTPLGHLRVRFLPILYQKCKQKQTLFT